MSNPRAAFLESWRVESPLLTTDAPNGTSRLLPMGHQRVRVVDQGNGGGWPSSTDQWCRYCCHPFEGPPLPMPIKHDAKLNLFHVTGVFCSWGCMKSCNSESPSYLKSIISMNITLLHKRCTGRLGHVRHSPPRAALRVFGGSMTIDEFRAASGKPREYAVLPARMIVHHPGIQEIDVSAAAVEARRRDVKKRDNPMDAVVDFKDVPTRNETLRLKRPKPLQHNRNLLERAMGINCLVAAVTPSL